MIAEGYEHQARDLAEAAYQLAKESALSSGIDLDQASEIANDHVFTVIYSGAVRDVLRWLVGDMPEPTPWLKRINQRYSDNIDLGG